MSQSARCRRLLVLVLSALSLVLLPAGTASASGAPPQCFAPGTITVQQGEVFRFSAYSACSDPDGDPLTLVVTEQPVHGTISGPDISGQFTYSPTAGYLGADSFKAQVSDGTSQSAVATVSIQIVAAVNDPPSCFASLPGPPAPPGGRITVEAGDTSQGTISCSDPEGADLTFTVHDQPDHGTVTDLQENQPFPGSQSARFTYTVDADHRGQDEFTLRVSDGANPVDAVLRVNVVEPVNDSPACFASMSGAPPGPDGRYAVEAGDAAPGGIGCSDDEGDPLTFSVFDGPEHGTLSPLQVHPPSGGAFRSASLTYTSEAAYRGPDEFTLRVSDGAHDVNTVVKLQVVEPVNNPPVCSVGLGIPSADGRFPVEDDGTAAPGSLSCSDDEGDDLTFTVHDGPDHGTLSALQEQPSGSGSSFVTFTYRPTAGYRGPDEFTLRASDGTHTVDRVVRVTVIDPADNPPQCFAGLAGAPPGPGERVEVEAGEAVSGSMFCTDDEGANLAFAVAEAPEHGTISSLNESPGGPGSESVFFTYTPAAAYRGPDEFTLRASDGTNPVERTIKVTVVDPVNVPPDCELQLFGGAPGPGGRYEVEAGEPQDGEISCVDDEGVDIEFSVLDAPEHGTLSPLDSSSEDGFAWASFTYTPAAAYRGPDEFRLRASDGVNHVDLSLEVSVVEPVDDPPECFDAFASVRQPQSVVIHPDCFDDEGETLAYTVTQQPQHGTLTANPANGGWTYTPNAGFTGTDSFSYKASDGTAETEVVTVEIQVRPALPDTTITAGPAGTTADSTPTFEFSATESGSTFECRVDTGAFVACASPHTTTALADGPHTFHVRAKDPSGSPDPSPASRSFTVAAGSGGGGGVTGGGGGTGSGGAGGGTGTGGGTGATPAVPCQGLTGSAKAKCRLDLRIEKKCGALKGKKKSLCAKRERALSKCDALKSKTPAQKTKKKSCVRKAKKIGSKKKP